VADVPFSPVCGFVPVVTFTTAVSYEQVAFEPLRKVTVYGAVPPDHVTVAVRLEVCPESITEG
jgi:hypothetical protein